MAPVSRTALFAKIHKVLKKYYKPVAPPPERSVLEHILFACCLEDARNEAAEEAFAALVHTFFDWNEVRVTSISELSEVLAALPDPRVAANRLKRVLHGVFEELYSFDLEDRRKKNLGPTVKWLEKVDGTTKFVVAYVIQSALGGHSIPLDGGTLATFRVLGLVSDKELASGEVPGLERAVAKSKGVEFGSLVHQLGADFSANPYSPQVHDILLQIEPDSTKRFPQRRAPRDASAPGGAKSGPATPKPGSAKPGAAKPGPEKASSQPADAAPAAGRKKKEAEPKPAVAESRKGGQKSAAPREAPVGKEEKLSKAGKKSAGDSAKEHSPAEGLAKRKPR